MSILHWLESDSLLTAPALYLGGDRQDLSVVDTSLRLSSLGLSTSATLPEDLELMLPDEVERGVFVVELSLEGVLSVVWKRERISGERLFGDPTMKRRLSRFSLLFEISH